MSSEIAKETEQDTTSASKETQTSVMEIGEERELWQPMISILQKILSILILIKDDSSPTRTTLNLIKNDSCTIKSDLNLIKNELLKKVEAPHNFKPPDHSLTAKLAKP